MIWVLTIGLLVFIGLLMDLDDMMTRPTRPAKPRNHDQELDRLYESAMWRIDEIRRRSS